MQYELHIYFTRPAFCLDHVCSNTCLELQIVQYFCSKPAFFRWWMQYKCTCTTVVLHISLIHLMQPALWATSCAGQVLICVHLNSRQCRSDGYYLHFCVHGAQFWGSNTALHRRKNRCRILGWGTVHVINHSQISSGDPFWTQEVAMHHSKIG